MVLSLCGGSPGDRDELDPGNGSTGGHAASVERAAAAVAKGRVEGASAQDNTFAAAEAALQVHVFWREGGGGGKRGSWPGLELYIKRSECGL